MHVYFDANASDSIRPEAEKALLHAIAFTGNPASVHAAGRAARRALEDARTKVAARFDVSEEQVIFTSGGTEANALAIHGLAKSRRILIGATEHESVRRAAPGAEEIVVTPDGQLCLSSLQAALRDGPPALVCVMAANNETGVINPLDAVSELCSFYGADLHVDAVQAAARFKVSMHGITSLALSGHKAGGVKGGGALLVKNDARLTAMMPGGGQERGRRGGTPALPALAAMAAALDAAHAQDWSEIDTLRAQLEAAVKESGGRIVGADAPQRLVNTICVVLPGMRAQTQLMTLDLAGFCVSTGSACSSGKVAGSHTLAAMGLGAVADDTIRISLPWNVTPHDVEGFCAAYQKMAQRRGGVGDAA